MIAKNPPLSPFQDSGTVLMSDMFSVNVKATASSVVDVVGVMRMHLDFVMAGIERNGGVVEAFIGGAVVAYWRSEIVGEKHAQLAFDTACTLLQSLPRHLRDQQSISYDMDFILGTGEMSGSFFGPTNQFQVMGKAKAIADRISRYPRKSGSWVRLSQYSSAILDKPINLERSGTIARDAQPDLELFSYSPPKRSSFLSAVRNLLGHRI